MTVPGEAHELRNPYRPGAGHAPPYLAGREAEIAEFGRLLTQEPILENMVLTGLRGVGKTVLLERFKETALDAGWLWVGADLSESASISEANLSTRLVTDLSVVTSGFTVIMPPARNVGFSVDQPKESALALNHAQLAAVYDSAPGLASDKLRVVLDFVDNVLKGAGTSKVVFAYDEAQNLSDHKDRDQFPLSLLLDVFQSLQRRGVQFMLLLVGLPTLFPKLVEARTFAERMFHVVTLGRLDRTQSRDAVTKPIEASRVQFAPESVEGICQQAGGYPYFIQFICREVFDAFIILSTKGQDTVVPGDAIQAKLDADFFSGRWARATDRQRELLWVIARLGKDDDEFTIQEVVAVSQQVLDKPFSSSHVNQMMVSLSNQGLIYKNRFGKYSFAVPLMGPFILRTYI